MDTSKFNLWRACFSFCFVDGFLIPEEQEWIESKLSTLPFSAEQRQTLMKDLKSPPDIINLLPLITKPADRGFLVNQIRFLAELDFDLPDTEKAKIDEVHQAVMSRIDLNALSEVIAKDERESYHEDEVYKLDKKHFFTERMFNGLLRLLNPGDYKFPDEK